VPRRSTSWTFGDTEYVTRPSPCPSRGAPIEIQPAFDEAVQLQSRVVVTAIEPLPPDAGKLDGLLLAVI
jgi:hypothetical protein